MENRIKIAYFVDHLYPGGGTENQLLFLLKNLDKTKFFPVVYVLRCYNSHMPEIPKVTIPDCQIQYLSVNSFKGIRFLTQLFLVVWQLRRLRVSIVHVFFFDGQIFGTVAARLAGIRNIVYSRRDSGWWHTPIKVFFARILARFSSYCVVNAEAVKQIVTSVEKMKPENVLVIHNSYSLEETPENTLVDPLDLDIPRGAVIVGIIANFREVKRVDIFVEIAKLVNDPKVVYLVLGDGPLKNQLLQQIKDLGLRKQFVVHHTTENIDRFIKMMDVGVLTSETEGLSNALIEMAYLGRPTVAFDVGGNSEIIVHRETGFVIPFGEKAQMADYIKNLVCDEALRLKMGNAAKAHAGNLFSPTVAIKSTEKFYAGLAPNG